MHPVTIVTLAALSLVTLTGCAYEPTHMRGESVVLAGTTSTQLLGEQILPASVKVTDAYLNAKTVYELNRDYNIDAAHGTIARTANSRIPDFSTNVLYNQKDFDQSHFPNYGNGKFFAWLDYDCKIAPTLVHPTNQTALLPNTLAKLKSGGPLKIIAFGDSITAGGEASSIDLRFPNRFSSYLKDKYNADIHLENTATGGDNTVNGIARLNDRVLTRHPDLVLIGFGMNDHNLPGVGGVPLPDFQNNLVAIVNQIRAKTGAEVILFSTFPPNPLWHYGSHQMDKYAAATQAAAEQAKCAYADVYSTFATVLQRKDPSSMLGNNINHPNDFGHWLYLQALANIGI